MPQISSLNVILHSILHPSDYDLPRGKSIEAPASRAKILFHVERSIRLLPRYFRTLPDCFRYILVDSFILSRAAATYYLCIFLPICFSTVSYAGLIDA